jgi:hypothetical protein
MQKLHHIRLFSHAFRTALLFISGFLIYEILLNLEKLWNKKNPNNKLKHFYTRKIYKFILIFVIDLAILYGLAIFFRIYN